MKYVSSVDTIRKLIECIDKQEPAIYLRFGDGDFNLMRGATDMLSGSSPEMIESYSKTMKYLSKDTMNSVNFHCKELNTLEEGMKPGIHENVYSSVCKFIEGIQRYIPGIDTLYSAVAAHHVLVYHPDVYIDLLQRIKENNSTIFLGNKDFDKSQLECFFGNISCISANGNNSFNERERLWKEFDDVISNVKDYTIVILALGCGGRAMSHSFIESIHTYGKKVLFFDIGSSIDALMGHFHTRAWIEMTHPDIQKLKDILEKKNHLQVYGKKYRTDKYTYHNYTDFYDSLFYNNKSNIRYMIELGILEGRSIQMWKDYFYNATIYGYDYDLKNNKFPPRNGIHLDYMDLANISSIESCLSKFTEKSIDIIIDDASHVSTHQRNALQICWKYLKNGGIYIIEDIHTNVKHWYPNPTHWNKHLYYWNESPTILEDLQKAHSGLPCNLPIPIHEIKQILFWSQPSTTSMICVLFKNE